MKSIALLALALVAGSMTQAAELYDHRGPNQDGVFPARDYITDFSLGEKLILWKTLLPAEGQNTPIVVKDRVFLLCSYGIESDCPELFCLSIADGKVLWRKPVDNLDALAPDVQKDAKDLRAKELFRNRKAREFYFRFKKLQAPDPNGGKGVVITDQEAFDKLKAEARELGILNEDAIQVHLSRDGNYFKRFPFEYLGSSATNPERRAEYTKLYDNDWFRYEGWHYIENLYTGRTFPSPVSDGKYVYVFTQDGTVACFDLDGNRNWLVDAMRVADSSLFVNTDKKGGYDQQSLVSASPALIGNTLVVYNCMEAVALEKTSGKELWRYATDTTAAYSESSTPVHLTVDGIDCLYLASGQIVRLSDGKKVGLLDAPEDYKKGGYKWSHFGSYFDAIGRGNRLWMVNQTDGGGSKNPAVFHFTLRKEGEGIVGDLKWYEQLRDPCIAMVGDEVHQVDLRGWQVFDTATGKKTNGRGIRGINSRYFVFTDQHLIAIAATGSARDSMEPPPVTGTVLVYDKVSKEQVGELPIPSEPAEGKVLAQRIARVALPYWHTYGACWGVSSPMPWGNRIIVRNNDAVYCLGMPGTEYKAP